VRRREYLDPGANARIEAMPNLVDQVVRADEQDRDIRIGADRLRSAVYHDGGSIIPAEEVNGDPRAARPQRPRLYSAGPIRGSRRHPRFAAQTSTIWRPLYVPQTAQTACGSFGERHCGQATVATTVAFQFARRDRVLLRDILRLGTATVAVSSS